MGESKNFHIRLKQACDDNVTIPEKGSGRQVWFARKLNVSEEAVRKWFTGEARPRVDMMDHLSKLLGVDTAWLSLGVAPELNRVEHRAWSERAEGMVYVLFGHLLAVGAHCAFPSKSDSRADLIDFYAIYRGQQLALHVSVAREISKHNYVFPIPRKWNECIVVGMIPVGTFAITVLQMHGEDLQKHIHKKAGNYELNVTKVGSEYLTGDTKWPLARTDLMLQ